MSSSTRELIERLAVGPSFLLLGQALFQVDGRDPVLASAADSAGVDAQSFTDLLAVDPSKRERLFDTLANVGRSAALPSWLAPLSSFPWNGVYTSLIDNRVARALEAEWRRVVPMAGSEITQRHPRSPNQLGVHMLYGGVGLPPEQRPPHDALEFALRRNEASTSLDTLTTSLLTPRGVLLIDGWRPGDWLDAERLYALAGQLLPGQGHLFSTNDDAIESDPFIQGAVNQGLLTLHRRSLASLLSEAQDAGQLVAPPSTGRTDARLLRLGGRFVPVPVDVWSGIIETARPIDDSLLLPPRETSRSLRYQQFRAFLGTSEGSTPWSALAAGFSFRREFEVRLHAAVMEALQAKERHEPLVVAGQSASGKSTALAMLAVDLARAGDVAVVHLARRGERPRADAIERFALWAEESGADATLVVWDGMTDAEEYYDLGRRLRSRGRRTLVVGSSYLSADHSQGRLIAPSQLTSDESKRIREWLESFDVLVDERDLAAITEDASFLAALYRLLPETRRGVQKGLGIELRSVEAEMERFARQFKEESHQDLGIMAAALRRAGLELPAFDRVDHEADLAEVDFGDRSTAERLTGMVVAAGRRNLRVPLDLVLRSLGREGSRTVIEAVKQFDIIRWSDDENGDQYLGVRTALEAELIARQDLRDPRAELAVIETLVSETIPRPGLGGPEVQFVVDLLDQIGPDSEDGDRFKPFYPQIVEALRQVRSTPGHANPRLMLKEGNLARKWVIWAQKNDAADPTARLAALRSAETVLEEAMELAPPSGRARLNLHVELASVLGAQAFELQRSDGHSAVLEGLAERVVSNALAARAVDPENYYPVDVVAWVTIDLSVRGELSDAQRMNLAANALASMSSIDPDALSPSQRAKYQHRQADLARQLGDDARAAEHLERLAGIEDPAAYFLLALRQSGLLSGAFDKEGATASLDRLERAPLEVREDWRVSSLMLDLFWMARTGKRFLQGQREALAFGRDDWLAALSLIDVAVGVARYDRYRVTFLRGLAHFHLGEFSQSLAAFAELDKASANLSKRVIASFVAADSSGKPVRFSGQVRSVLPDGRSGRVWVEQLNAELPFFPLRFGMDDPRRGDPLPEFHVAFNMRGPYADPIRVSQPHRPR